MSASAGAVQAFFEHVWSPLLTTLTGVAMLLGLSWRVGSWKQHLHDRIERIDQDVQALAHRVGVLAEAGAGRDVSAGVNTAILEGLKAEMTATRSALFELAKAVAANGRTKS